MPAIVTIAAGDVQLDGSGTSRPATLDPDAPLVENGLVRVPRGGRFAFQWGDGSGAHVDGDALLALRRLRDKEQELELVRGRVAVRVGPHHPGEVMRVISPRHVVTVHGTWFVVTAEPEGTRVEVLEGVVEVGARDGVGPGTRLPAPQRAFFYNHRSTPSRARDLSASEATRLRTDTEMGLLPWASSVTDMLASTRLLDLGADGSAGLSVDGVDFGHKPLAVRRPLGGHLVDAARPGQLRVPQWIDVATGEHEPIRLAVAPKADVHAADVEVQALANAHKQQVSSCYERALKRDPSLAGRLLFEIDIDSEGHVGSARRRRGPVRDRQLLECLGREVSSWSFPTTRSAKVVYPFDFRAD